MDLKKFINGFRKINYEFPLIEDFSHMPKILSEESSKLIEYITHEISMYPIENVSYGVSDFKVERLSDKYLEKLYEGNKPIYLFKDIAKNYKSMDLMENNVLSVVISLGLDNHPYKFEVKSFFTCNCYTTSFNDEFSDFCVFLADVFLKNHNINGMIKRGFEIDIKDKYLKDESLISRKHFEGCIKTLGDNNFFKEFDVNEIVDVNDYETDDSIIEKSIADIPFSKYINENTLLVDVVRKTKTER